ncbi:hypothetical protein AGMMS50249_1930 [candidate division SR1 bacterium]|nr:hypothetical protein AGMMS50249_1930 [candidate division SR1 bacterium]
MIWIWIGIIVILVLFFIAKKAQDNNSEEINDTIYTQKKLLTDTEKSFLDTMKPLEDYGITIVPQVCLASIVNKNSNSRRQNELYRIVDFGLFDADYNLLLLVELNDASHKEYSRRKRDNKVSEICGEAKIDLMTFYTDKPNKQEYVLHRISEKIREKNKL